MHLRQAQAVFGEMRRETPAPDLWSKRQNTVIENYRNAPKKAIEKWFARTVLFLTYGQRVTGSWGHGGNYQQSGETCAIAAGWKAASEIRS
jgi:hypothetical protein